MPPRHTGIPGLLLLAAVWFPLQLSQQLPGKPGMRAGMCLLSSEISLRSAEVVL